MRRGAGAAIQALTLLMLWVSTLPLFAQAPKPPSLQEQLEAQYPPQTLLAIQKEGILGVVLASSKTCPAKYQDGKLSPPDASCTAPLKDPSRPLPVGQKVNPAKIDVDLAKERISFRIVECASCNPGSESSPYKSQIDFQFGKGYLEKAGVSQIEDTISEVLAFDAGADQQAQPAPDSQAEPGQPGEAASDVLTNSDVVKMARVKLADGIIISKIKTSACNFDTSVDALVKLKEAGVSDPVIQAMHDAQEAAKAPANELPANEPVPAGNPVAGSPEATLHDGNPALVFHAAPDMTIAVDLVNHNGERALRFPVLHSHFSDCSGYLYVSQNHIAYDPVFTPKFQKDTFDLERAQITSAWVGTETYSHEYLLAIFRGKKRYLFYALFDSPSGRKYFGPSGLRGGTSAGPVYQFIGRSLSDFDSVLHEAETLTASLTQRP